MLARLLKPIQALKFTIVGIIATLVHLLVSTLLVHLIFEHALISNLLGYCIALPISFLGHAKFTYQSELSIALFAKFFLNTAWILVFSLITAFVMDIFSVNKYIATVFSVLVFPLLSYVVHTHSTFRDKV